MYPSKLFFSLAITGMLAFSSAAPAAVHNFGSLRPATRDAAAATSSIDDETFASSMNFGFTSGMSQHESGFVGSNQIEATTTYLVPGSDTTRASGKDTRISFDQGSRIRHSKDEHWIKPRVSDKRQTVTSPVPEPETYAMILAGLALIGFTARRRNQNS